MTIIRTFLVFFALALALPAQNTRLNNATFTGTLNGTPSGGTLNLGNVTLTNLTNASGLPLMSGTTGTLTTARGGTGLTSLGTGGQVLRTNSAATAMEWSTSGVMLFAYRSTDVSLASGSTATTLVFNVENIDTASAHNTTTGEFTVPTTGTYLVETSLFWTPGTNNITGQLFVNGTRVKQLTQQFQSSALLISQTSVLSLTAGQVLTFRVSQDQGTNRTIGGYGDNYTFLKITKFP